MARQGAAQTIKDTLAQRIRADIVTGVLAPGLIVRDLELAEQYGVSTSPVREALLQLAAEGLIDMPPNRPKQVSRLDRKTALDMVEVHSLLGIKAWERGAPRVDAEGLTKMRDAMGVIDANVKGGDAVAMLLGARQYNDVILRASNNEPLRRLTISTFSQIERIVVMWDLQGFMHPEALWEILRALEAGQPVEAVKRFRALARQLERDVSRLFR